MGEDNSPRCEFSARAKDYQGWSNAERPLVQGLTGAGRGWPASHLSSWGAGSASHLPDFNYCPSLPGHAHQPVK